MFEDKEIVTVLSSKQCDSFDSLKQQLQRCREIAIWLYGENKRLTAGKIKCQS